ncbi:hypothetical protein BSLA_03f1633 [Burkholderia stabilis]|nr:hypothetical protein BSLA_03f1633 [Burkholderia stabilis]
MLAARAGIPIPGMSVEGVMEPDATRSMSVHADTAHPRRFAP